MIYSPAIFLARYVVTFWLPCICLLLMRTPASPTLLLLFWKPRAVSFIKAGLSKQQIYLCLKIKVCGSKHWQFLAYFQGSLACSLLFPPHHMAMAVGVAAQPKGVSPSALAQAVLVWLIFNPACAWGGWDGGSAM